jgi:hypothetical protein
MERLERNNRRKLTQDRFVRPRHRNLGREPGVVRTSGSQPSCGAVAAAKEGRTMTIEVFCREGHLLRLKDRYAGRRGKCPRCGSLVNVPQAVQVNAAFIDSILNSDEEEARLSAGEHVLADENATQDQSGISLVGSTSGIDHGPIKECQRCHHKVHVQDNHVCPECGAYFTTWD